jgi:hypothetical protein
VYGHIRCVLAAVVLCGCASHPTSEWTNTGMMGGLPAVQRLSILQLDLDVHLCEHWSPAGGNRINHENFHACMIALGWEPMGEIAPPSNQLASQ